MSWDDLLNGLTERGTQTVMIGFQQLLADIAQVEHPAADCGEVQMVGENGNRQRALCDEQLRGALHRGAHLRLSLHGPQSPVRIDKNGRASISAGAD